MIFNIPCYFPIEASSRTEAIDRLAPFRENPRNPNLLPVEVIMLNATYHKMDEQVSEAIKIGASLSVPHVYCRIAYCNNLLAVDSAFDCESHMCRPGEVDQLIWAPWRANYGWDGSKSMNGKEPDRLRTYTDVMKYVESQLTGYSFSARKYSAPIDQDNEKIWSVWLYGYGWSTSKNCDGKVPEKLYTKKDAVVRMEEELIGQCHEDLANSSIRKYTVSN